MPIKNLSINYSRLVLLCLACLCMALSGAAQLLPDPKVVSPNSTDMDRFTEVPVDLFTGTPQINIPIHTLEYGSIKVPIGLRYHPASVSPTQQPGWVGLGWDLQSFGAITRRLRGYHDDLYGDAGAAYTAPQIGLNSYYPVPGSSFAQSGADFANLPNWDANSQLYADFTVSSVNPNGQTDLLADEFTFNFMGYSGTFYYSGAALGWQVVSNDNIKVTMNGFLSSTDIISAIQEYKQFSQPSACLGNCIPVGNQLQPNQFLGFTLTVPDGTQYVFGGKEAIEFDNDYRYNGQSVAPETFTFWANAWLLTKIIDANNHEVDLTYQRTYPTCNLYFSASYFSYTANAGGCSQGDLTSMNIVTNSHSGLYQWPMYLSTISSPNETITFNIGDATCLRYPDIALQSQSSDGLLQMGPQPSPTDHVYLSLLNAQTSNLRWEQLNSIVITNSPNNIYRQYAFTYSSSSSQRLTLSGFEEEDINALPIKKFQFGYNNVAGLPAAMDGDQTDAWGYYNGTTVNGQGLPAVYALKQPTPAVVTAGLLNQVTYPTGGYTKLTWEAHDYSQVVTTNRNGLTNPTPTPAAAGGSRINEIASYDANNNVLLDKKYYYRRGYTAGTALSSLVSSGILNGTPAFYMQVNNRTSYTGGATVSFTTGSLNSIGAYGYNGNGSYIGYDEVVEVNADGSYTRHFFTSYGADLNNVQHFDILPTGYLGWNQTEDTYFPMSTLDLERGKPIGLFEYTPNNTLVRKTINTYRSDAARLNNFVKLIDLGYYIGCSTAGSVIFASAHKQFSYDYYPVNKTVTTYDQDGNNPIVASESYTYNANNLISSKTTVNSNGETAVTSYNYPADFTDATSVAMTNAHILSPVIQTSTTINGQQQSLVHVYYYSPSAGIYVPQNVQEQVAANPIETRQQFYQYDGKGNPEEFSKTNDIHTVYLWSYHSQYPVAKIVGSTLGAVTAIVSQAALDATCVPNNDANVRTLLQTLRSSLPNSLVSSYTYLPGIGITSETDPRGQVTYYKYDSFQRLQSLTDNDGNILKTFNYNYVNP